MEEAWPNVAWLLEFILLVMQQACMGPLCARKGTQRQHLQQQGKNFCSPEAYMPVGETGGKRENT